MESHNHFSPHVDEPVFEMREECLIKNEEIEGLRERIRELEELCEIVSSQNNDLLASANNHQ